MSLSNYQIDAKITKLEQELNELKKERSKVGTIESALSKLSNGSIIQFEIKYDSYGKTYNYAALKQAGVWYTTSKKGYDTTKNSAELADLLSTYDVRVVNTLKPAYAVLAL